MSRQRSSSLKLRKLAFERDRGICANCAADCEKIKRVYWAILDFDAQCWYGDILKSGGRVFWEADHIIEVVNNGSDSLRNLQTLCVACHRAKTVRLIFSRAPSGPPIPFKPIHSCNGYCDEAAWFDHGYQIMRSLEARYDANFYITDMPKKRLIVNIGPKLKADYMQNAHGHVLNHQFAIYELLAEEYEEAALDAGVM